MLPLYEYLLEHGSITHVRNRDGQIPLHMQCVVETISRHHRALTGGRSGRPAEYTTGFGMDEGESVEAVQLLLVLKRGAIVCARSNDNRRTPLQLAEERGREETIQSFSEHMRNE